MAVGDPTSVRLKHFLSELDFANIQSDSELFKTLLLGTFNSDSHSEEVRDMSLAFGQEGEDIFRGHIRPNARGLSNKITGMVKALIRCEYAAFQGILGRVPRAAPPQF
jgi:hypothetical protein